MRPAGAGAHIQHLHAGAEGQELSNLVGLGPGGPTGSAVVGAKKTALEFPHDGQTHSLIGFPEVAGFDHEQQYTRAPAAVIAISTGTKPGPVREIGIHWTLYRPCGCA